MRLKNKTALITGAGSGYGAGIAKRFAQEGANVMIADIEERSGRAVGEQINSGGGRAAFVKVDVSNAQDVANLLASVINDAADDVFPRIESVSNLAHSVADSRSRF